MNIPLKIIESVNREERNKHYQFITKAFPFNERKEPYYPDYGIKRRKLAVEILDFFGNKIRYKKFHTFKPKNKENKEYKTDFTPCHGKNSLIFKEIKQLLVPENGKVVSIKEYKPIIKQ